MPDSDRKNNEQQQETPSAGKVRVPRKFKDEWLQHPEFSVWLEKVETDPYKARCKLCWQENECYEADISVLRGHKRSAKHTQREQAMQSPNYGLMHHLFEKPANNPNELNTASSRAKTELAAFLVKYNIDPSKLNLFIGLIKECLPDSEIAQNMPLEETN